MTGHLIEASTLSVELLKTTMGFLFGCLSLHDRLVKNMAETLGNPPERHSDKYTGSTQVDLGLCQMTPEVGRIGNLYFNVEPHKRTQKHPKPPKANHNNQKKNRSLGKEAHTLDTSDRHFGKICAT